MPLPIKIPCLIGTLQVDVHNLFLKLQRINKFIKTQFFESTYTDADEDQQSKVVNLIKDLKHEDVLRWTRFNNKHTFEYYNIGQLRDYSKSIGFKNVNSKTKDQLLSEIYQYRIEHEANHP